MAGNQVTLTFAGDAAKLEKAAGQAAKATDGVGDAAARAGKQSQDTAGHMAKLSVVTIGVTDAVEQAGATIADLSNIQNQGKERAAAHARALLDMEQAGADAEQATRDLKQATLDLSQAQVDATQAAADVDQAMLDQKQAALDAQVAQEEYNQAVKENGPNSAEARQASLDLAQAQQDLKQAGIDVTQAQQDQKQATEDAAQAQQDQKQAVLDGKSAALDYADAQREAANTTGGWRANIETATSVATGLAGAVGLIVMASDALKVSTIATTAAMVASKVATIASAAATGIATAAQWAWNAAFAASGIGLIIIAVIALVAAIIYIAVKTDWFQRAWRASWGWIKAAAIDVWDWLKSLPDRLGAVFSRVANFISAPFRAAFNWVADAWNRTVGSLSWTVPGWVPGIGGASISAPRLPKFHTGGVVPGTPGQEVVALLQAGERVTPAGQGGGSESMTVRVVGDGDTQLARFLQSLARQSILQFEVTS